MFWTIEHLAIPYSATDITDWAVELRMVMPRHDWHLLARYLDVAVAFVVPADQVGPIADVLDEAACSVYLHPTQVRITEDIAAAARKAAAMGTPWRWS